MGALDDRLGLSPKGMAALRWSLDDAPTQPPTRKKKAPRTKRSARRLTAVPDLEGVLPDEFDANR
jgi:hypothetical protein